MSEISAVISEWSHGKLPELFVFDLDYTLWPFWIDTHVEPPFKKDKNGRVFDRYKTLMEPYSGVKDILTNLKEMNFKIAAASRTEAPKAAKDFLKLIDIDHCFDIKEIYPGCTF